MAVVPPAEPPAGASITAVPRTVAAALSPRVRGISMGISSFRWPLVVSSTINGIYDLLLLAMFRRVSPPEEAAGARSSLTR